MTKQHCRRKPASKHTKARRRRTFHRARIEFLEPRYVMSAPTLAAIADISLFAGAPLHIPLDGFDADGDALTYTVTSSNSSVAAVISPQTNRSLRFTMQGFGTGGTDGVMELQLFEDLAPGTTARIIQLAQTPRSGQPSGTGFYDGLTFHRVMKDFMIQGGDPDGDGTGGSGVDFDDEFSTSLLHTSSGILSMAKGGDDTNDSQFFITAVPTRYLDFNHTVFGFLTKGDEVREAIENTDVTGSTPDTDVVMKSVRVFTDTENGVLRLSAPHGTFSSSTITVTVSDGHGGTASQTFQVNVLQDDNETGNAYPYLLPIQPIRTGINTPAQFTIPAQDVEGDAIYYAGEVISEGKLTLNVDSTTGVATVTPVAGTAPGVYAVSVYARAVDPKGYFEGRDVWDAQAVPVLVHPAAPTAIELLTSSDTGLSTTDGITNRNNTSGNTLSFRVSGVIDGADVRLYADGQLVGLGTATGDSAVIVTDGTTALTDGAHAITARQFLHQNATVGNLSQTFDMDSQMSASVSITVDTVGPQFTSTPVENAWPGTPYSYDVQTSNEAPGQIQYSLLQSPAGMIINHDTGVITWTPTTGVGLQQAVSVRATDAAGNTADQTFTIQVGTAPQIAPIADQQVVENSLLTFTVSAVDEDLPLVYSLGNGAPPGAALDPATGVFTWTPTEAQGPGEYQITVRATDSLNLTSSRTVRVSVTEANVAPVLAELRDQDVAEGQLLELSATATDADLPANTLTYSLGPSAPAGAAINPSSGHFTWRPGEEHGGGSYAIVVRVTDSGGASHERSFTVTVAEVQLPPAFTQVPTQSIRVGETLSVAVHASDPDGLASSIVYSLEPGAPAGVALDGVTGLLIWQVPEDFTPGSVPIAVRATEMGPGGTAGMSSLTTVSVLVKAAVTADALGAVLALEASDLLAPVTLPASSIVPDFLLAAEVSSGTLPAQIFLESSTVVQGPLLGDSGLFGTQIGVPGGSGGSVQPSSARKDQGSQEQPNPTVRSAPTRPAAPPREQPVPAAHFESNQPSERATRRVPLDRGAIDAALEILFGGS